MNPDKYKKCQIIFGSGGGFANLVNEYYLLENGKLYQKHKTDTVFVELGRQKLDSVKLIFSKTKVLFDTNEDFHEPGNMYYFIKFKKDSTIKEVVWGSSDKKPKPEVKELYKELMNLVDLK
jgi:hypothetical protein